MPEEKDLGVVQATTIHVSDPNAPPSQTVSVNFHQVGGGFSFQRNIPVSDLSAIVGKRWRLKLVEETL